MAPTGPDGETESDGETGTDEETGVEECSRPGCDRVAAVRLHVPWADDEEVCTPHGRSLAQRDGVVAEPLDVDQWE